MSSLESINPSNISKYLSEGMSRFVEGRYADAAKQSGMIAYVIDGNCGKAFTSIDERITEKAAALSCHPPGTTPRSLSGVLRVIMT